MPPDLNELFARNMRLQPPLAGGVQVRAGAAALVGVLLIALLDFATGYEVRLAILYLLPIAFATWHGGAAIGLLVAGIAVGCWAGSFYANNIYSNEIFYVWEGCVLALTFTIFVFLLNRLRLALQHADRRFRDVLDGLSAAVYAVSERSGIVLYANRHLTDLMRMDPVGKAGRPVEMRFKPIDAESAVAGQGVRGFRHYEAHDERAGRWYWVQSGEITWETGELAQLKVLMDITEQRQASALRQQHQEMLHNTARFAVLAEIASMIGHEINQPLMAISSYTSASILLLSGSDPDIGEAVVALEKARVQVARSSNIIERTRGFLRRRAPSMSDGDINAAVRSAAGSMELTLQAPLLSFQMHLADDLPTLLFDRILIEQVVVNLLANALDALSSASTQVRRIEIATMATRDGAVQVTVSDNGIGLEPSCGDDVYEPFYTTKPGGLGLGLSICRSVIEAHAGRLWHHSAAGKGTTFHFTLPGIGPSIRRAM